MPTNESVTWSCFFVLLAKVLPVVVPHPTPSPRTILVTLQKNDSWKIFSKLIQTVNENPRCRLKGQLLSQSIYSVDPLSKSCPVLTTYLTFAFFLHRHNFCLNFFPLNKSVTFSFFFQQSQVLQQNCDTLKFQPV